MALLAWAFTFVGGRAGSVEGKEAACRFLKDVVLRVIDKQAAFCVPVAHDNTWRHHVYLWLYTLSGIRITLMF